MVVSKKLVVVLVFCLYGIIHGKQVEDVESIADIKKILGNYLLLKFGFIRKNNAVSSKIV